MEIEWLPSVCFLALLVLLWPLVCIVWLSIINGYEVGLNYSSNNDLSSFVVDAGGQMARFVAKTLSMCSRVIVLTYWAWGQRLLLLLLERWALIIADLRRKSTYICFLELQVASCTVPGSYPDPDNCGNDCLVTICTLSSVLAQSTKGKAKVEPKSNWGMP